MTEGKTETKPEAIALAVIGWILPLVGLLWGPGEWWQYFIWLVVGTAVILLYVHLVDDR